MDKNIKAKELMEKGWKAREDLNFEEAKKLLNEAKELFEQDKDWFKVTEALNHLAYTYRLKAVHHNLKGLQKAEEAMKVADKYKIRKMFVLRALMSLASSSGNYERALIYGMEALPLYKKPADKADTLSHITAFQLRTGKIKDAQKTIRKAEALFRRVKKEVDEPHKSIWESKIVLTKALIMYNKGQKNRAKKLGEKVLRMADKNGLKTRKEEIKSFLELFK